MLDLLTRSINDTFEEASPLAKSRVTECRP